MLEMLKGLILILLCFSSFLYPIQPISFIPAEEQTTKGFSPQYCTIFSASIGNKAYFGNNEDYKFGPETAFFSFIPPQTVVNYPYIPSYGSTIEIYGIFLVGIVLLEDGKYNYYPQGGMNDQGLCYDANSIPAQTLNTENADWRPLNSHWDLLWHCSNVSEVITWYQTHPSVFSSWDGQWHYMDASGAGVVVTAKEGHLVFVEKNITHLVSTNFNLADPSNRYFNYPCWRYEAAMEMLGEIEQESDLDLALCQEILDETHFERSIFDELYTMYSTIYDPIDQTIWLYFLNDFENPLSFNLTKECSEVNISENNHTYHSSLADNTYFMKDFFTFNYPNLSFYKYLLPLPVLVIGGAVIIVKRKKGKNVNIEK